MAGSIALNKAGGGQMILTPQDGTSTETVTIPSVGVGKILNMETYYNTTAYYSSSSSWMTHWTQTYTPLSASSTILVILSLNVLTEASNNHDVYLDWRGASGQYYMGFGKAGSLSGWNQNNNCVTYVAPSGGTTAGNIRLQWRGNGSNTSYINYNYGNGTATSTMTIMEVAG